MDIEHVVDEGVIVGAVKKHAGTGSGIRRSAKQALVVKKVWLDLILSGRKTWETLQTAPYPLRALIATIPCTL